jgi:hypothetical protein
MSRNRARHIKAYITASYVSAANMCAAALRSKAVIHANHLKPARSPTDLIPVSEDGVEAVRALFGRLGR